MTLERSSLAWRMSPEESKVSGYRFYAQKVKTGLAQSNQDQCDKPKLVSLSSVSVAILKAARLSLSQRS